MLAVGIREFKNRLSHYVRLVRSGESVLVTDRGEVVAEMRPPGTASEHADVPGGLLEMVRKGRASLALPREERVVPRFSRLTADGTAERLLDEERGER